MNGLAGEEPMPLSAVLELWDRVVVRWDLDEVERCALVGRGAGGPVGEVGTYLAEDGAARLRSLVEFAAVLDRAFGHERRVRFWLRAPNRYLDCGTPLDVMATSPEWVRWLTKCVGVAT